MTPEEIYKQKVALLEEEQNKAWLKYLADKFLMDGDLSIFQELQLKTIMGWHKALKQYETDHILADYLNARANLAIKYQQCLVDSGLADRTFTDLEMEYYDVRSWQIEKDNQVVIDDSIVQTEACLFAFRVFKLWLTDFHTAHVPSLTIPVVAPAEYTNPHQKTVWEETLVNPLSGITITQVQLDEFRTAKAS